MRLRFPWLALLASALLAGCSSSGEGTEDDDSSTQPAGDDDSSQGPVDADGDGYYAPEDCDDANPKVNPGATEECNGIDDNCDTNVDEAGAKGEKLWFADSDGDGYGNPLDRVQACTAPDNYVTDNTDCNDTSADAHPGGTEVCGDGLDNDCDGGANGCGIGGNVGLDTAPLVLSGEAAKDQYGSAIAPAGDVNKDGYPDILIGAYQEDSNGSSSGAAYLIYGPFQAGSSLAANKVVKFVGQAAGDWAGLAVAGAGDVNKDGYADVLIGAPYEDAGGTGAGAAYLIYGPIAEGTFDLANADVKLTGEAESDAAGYAVSSAGDVNNDGYADILIGAWSAGSEDGPEAGAAYLLLGPVDEGTYSLGTADTKFVGEASYYLAGFAVASGDFNGDHYSDVLIGAPYAGDASQGAAYVVYGPITAPVVYLADAPVKLQGEGQGDIAGRTLANAGDTDGDGKDDILIGAQNADSGVSVDVGAVYVVLGAPDGVTSLATAAAKLVGEAASDHAGRSVSSAGDVNGDHKADLLIGALGDSSARGDAGAVYLVYGPVTGVQNLVTASAKFNGIDPDDKVGFAVSAAGDLDKDSFGDLLLGVPDRSSSTDFHGSVYVFMGGMGL